MHLTPPTSQINHITTFPLGSVYLPTFLFLEGTSWEVAPLSWTRNFRTSSDLSCQTGCLQVLWNVSIIHLILCVPFPQYRASFISCLLWLQSLSYLMQVPDSQPPDRLLKRRSDCATHCLGKREQHLKSWGTLSVKEPWLLPTGFIWPTPLHTLYPWSSVSSIGVTVLPCWRHPLHV